MKITKSIFIILIFISAFSCVTPYMPDTEEEGDFLVVEGLITDRAEANKIIISKASQLSSVFSKIPVTNAKVSINDDLGKSVSLTQLSPGIYITSPVDFKGEIGRKYILNISAEGFNCVSDTVEMKPVPQIGEIKGEKVYNNAYRLDQMTPGYQVTVSTYDPSGECRYFRWDFLETWEFHLPYDHPTIKNRVCWKSRESVNVYIKSTKSLSESKITEFPINFITAETDRLTVKYSLLLRQYSINEDEYFYWEKVQKMNEETGGLYDVVPVSIKSNINCIEDPYRHVLGYFSVSAVTEKRLFIHPEITGFPDFYKGCPNDTVYSQIPNPRLNISEFIIMDYMFPGQSSGFPFWIVTYNKACQDCTMKGTNVKPPFWDTENAYGVSRDNFDFSK
jgi:hypothetical protein